MQEPVGSDFSSGATLATVGDIQNVASALQAVGFEKIGGMDGLVEGSSFLNDNNFDKADDSLPGTSRDIVVGFITSKFKPLAVCLITVAVPRHVHPSCFHIFHSSFVI